MLCYYYGRIDVSERIDIIKTNASKECDIFDYWDFLDKMFKFQKDVSNKYHDVSELDQYCCFKR